MLKNSALQCYIQVLNINFITYFYYFLTIPAPTMAAKVFLVSRILLVLLDISCIRNVVSGFQLKPTIRSIPAWAPQVFPASRTGHSVFTGAAAKAPSFGQPTRKKFSPLCRRSISSRTVMSASARDKWSVTGVGITTVSRPFAGEPGADVTTWRHDEHGTGIELWQVGPCPEL